MLEKNYKLTEITYIPGELNNFVEVTIRMILSRHNSGNCRIIPIVMEENALSPIHKETFDDIVLHFIWHLDYSGDDTYEYVSQQLIKVISQWSLYDRLTTAGGENIYDDSTGSYSSSGRVSSVPGVSTSTSARSNTISMASIPPTNNSNDAHLREIAMPWSSYRRAVPLVTPAPEPAMPSVKTLPQDMISDFVAVDSVDLLEKQKLFGWLVHFFDFYQPSVATGLSAKDMQSDGSSIPGGKFNFNRVEYVMHLLVEDGVCSMEQFVKLYLDTRDPSSVFVKYFKKALAGGAKEHDEHHTSVYEGDLENARATEEAWRARNESSLLHLVEVMRLHVPAVYVCLPPVIKFDDLPEILYGDRDRTRASHENSVLYSICPLLITPESTLQEITLVLQLCIQFVSMSPVVSAAGSWHNDIRSPSTSRATPLDAVSSKVIVSSVPTLSLKHPINVRLAKLQSACLLLHHCVFFSYTSSVVITPFLFYFASIGSVVAAIYGSEYIDKSDVQLHERMEDISSALGLTQVPTALSPIGSRHRIAAESGQKATRHPGFYFDSACCLLLQAMQELATRFTTFITNRIIADDGITPPPAAYIKSEGGASPTVTGTPPVDAHAFINPMDEFCMRLHGATVLCDSISAFVSIGKHLHGEMAYRRRTQPRRFYKSRCMDDVEALMDDDYLEAQRRQLHNVFCVNSLLSLNSLFTKLSQTPPAPSAEPVRVTDDSDFLVTGDWKYEGVDVGDSGYNCYDHVSYAGSGPSSPYSKQRNASKSKQQKREEGHKPLSILLRLLYCHNVNNILACCQYSLCEGLVALVRPSALTPSDDNPLGEIIAVLYSVTLLHMTSCEVGCRKLSVCKVGSILEYMMTVFGSDKCSVNHLISWPAWLIAVYRYVGLYSTLWITVSNLAMSERLSKLLIGSSKVCCTNLIVALCHGYQQLFRFYDEIIEIEFQVPEVKPVVKAGSALVFHQPVVTSALPSGASAHVVPPTTHLSKAEIELVVFNLLTTMSSVVGLAEDGSVPAAAMHCFEELVSFDVMRFIVQSIFNNISTVLSSTNVSLGRIRHVPPADIASTMDDTINSCNLYVLLGACKAIHGLVSNSHKLKASCIDNSGIKILSNAFSIVYADQELVIEVLFPLLRLLLVENSATVLIAETTANVHARKRLFTQFCEGNGHNYLALAMEKYFMVLVKKLPLTPGSVDVCMVVLRDLLILTFWVMYHGNVKKSSASSGHSEPSIEDTDGLVSLLSSTGLNDIMTKIFVQYTNRLLDVFRHFTASETTDEASEDTRSVGNPASETSSLAAMPHASTSGRMGRHGRFGLSGIDEEESLGGLVSTQSQAAVHTLSIAQISEEELIHIVTVDYICKILCFQVTNENCRLLLGTTEGFCQSLLNILTLACKLMIVYEKIEREHVPFEDEGAGAPVTGEASPEVQKQRRATFKSSLIYIISECCFIFRALTVESCNQTNILKQPTLGTSSGETEGLAVNPAAPYSTWYMCILAAMKLYMYIHTIPVPKSKALDPVKMRGAFPSGNMNITPGPAGSGALKRRDDDDEAMSVDYSTYSAEDSDCVTSAGDSGMYSYDASQTTDSSMTRITATVPAPHFASLLSKTAELGSPADWCSSMTDVSLGHVLHGALYLTCGTGLSASIMDIIFGHFSHNTEKNVANPLAFHQNDACTVMAQLLQEFVLFIRLFTTQKTSLTLILWEIMRRQSLIWLFPYHNTTIPKNFLYPNKNAPHEHGYGHSHGEYDDLSFGDSDEEGGDDSSIENHTLVSFDAIEEYRLTAFRDGVLDTQQTPRNATSGDDVSGASNDSCVDRNYTARMEDETKPGVAKLTHHNNYTSSSMKYLAALQPNINISKFLPFSKSGKIITEGDDIHGSDSVSSSGTSNRSYFAAKLSAWIIGGNTKKEQKTKAKVLKEAKLSNFSGRKTAVAVMTHGLANAAGANTVSNRKNPVHHMLWSFHKAYNIGSLHERHAPNNAFPLSEAPHLNGPTSPCIYDTIYSILATCCGITQFSECSIHAMQLVIVILQGYIHDKDAFRQLCKVLYQRKIFDVCMKYLLVICEPPLNTNTIESLAALEPAPQHQDPGKVDAEKVIEYLGKTYVCSPQAATKTYDAFRDMGGKTKNRGIGSRGARGALPPLTAVPYVNMTDPLSQFIDEIDCGFPTVRSEVEGHHHRNWYGDATPRNRAGDSKAPPPIYPIEVEMDMVKYIGSMCSYAAVDEDTRYVLREVLYAQKIFAKVAELPRYELSATTFVEPERKVDNRSLTDMLVDLERRDEMKAERDREEDAIRHARKCFIPQLSTTSFLPLQKVQQIRKVLDTVSTNLNWKDPRLNRYQQLEEVIDRMTGEFRGRNMYNTDKQTMLSPNNNFLSKKTKRRKNLNRIG